MICRYLYCFIFISFHVHCSTNFESYLFFKETNKNDHVFSQSGFEEFKLRFKQDNRGEKDLTLRVKPQFLNKFSTKNQVLKMYDETNNILKKSIACNGILERYVVGINLFYMYKEKDFLTKELKKVKEILNKTKTNSDYLDVYYKLSNTLDIIEVELIDLESSISSFESEVARDLKKIQSKVLLNDFITLSTIYKNLKSFSLRKELPLFEKKNKMEKQIFEGEYRLERDDLIDFVGVGFQVDDKTEDKKIAFEVALNLPVFENSLKHAKSTLSYIEKKRKNAIESVQKKQYYYSLLNTTLKRTSYYLRTIKKRKNEILVDRSIDKFVTKKIHVIKKERDNLKFEKEILINYINIIASFGFDLKNENINFLKNKIL